MTIMQHNERITWLSWKEIMEIYNTGVCRYIQLAHVSIYLQILNRFTVPGKSYTRVLLINNLFHS